MPRPFRVPFATFTGVAGVLVCLAMTAFLPHDTWIRLAVWTFIGFLIYFLYGYRHSRIRQQV
jgi:APA family basic amino acid/polyamine antiporter